MAKTIQEISFQEVPLKKKVEFFQKEKRSGKQKVFRGAKELKQALQAESKSLADVGKIAKKATQANQKINAGRQQILFASREIVLLNIKSKKGLFKKKNFFK